MNIDTFNKIISSRKCFDISSNFYKEKEFSNEISNDKSGDINLKIYYIAVKTEHKNHNSVGNRTFTYINQNKVTKNNEWINKWKVCIPIARGGDRNDKFVLSKTLISEPNSIVSESFRIVYKNFKSEEQANLYSSYLESRFFRYLVSIVKLTQNAPKDVYKFIPNLDIFKLFPNWQKCRKYEDRINTLDLEIMEYFNLSKNEIEYIFNSISLHNKKLENDYIEINENDDN